MHRRVSWLLPLFVLSGCFRTAPREAAPPAEAVSAPFEKSEKKSAKAPARDADLLRVVKLAVQADQVQREAWWVISTERRPAPKSAFGKLSRAALWALDGRLTTKGLFNCESYLFKKDDKTPLGPWSGTFSEKCGKGPEKQLAVWRGTGPRSARVEFSPANLGEVLGLGSSIFGKPLSCEISWTENEILSVLSCPNWEQDRGPQIVRLETYEYRRDEGNLLKLKGKVLENLLPVRKIEASVPLEGKITVVETELNPPEPDPARPPAPPTPPSGKKSVAAPGAAPAPGAPAPVDPDLLLKRQAAPVRPGSEASREGPAPDGSAVPPGAQIAPDGSVIAPESESTPAPWDPTKPPPGMDPSQFPPGTIFTPGPDGRAVITTPDGTRLVPTAEPEMIPEEPEHVPEEPDRIPENQPSNR